MYVYIYVHIITERLKSKKGFTILNSKWEIVDMFYDENWIGIAQSGMRNERVYL